MCSLNICTLNVNGLRNPVKRAQISTSCGSRKPDILLLQETHASGFYEARGWAKEFNSKGFWSFGTSSSCGVTILFSNRYSWKPMDQLRDNDGRLVSITTTLPGSKARVRIINCYAPNHPAERRRFFKEQLPLHTRGMRHIILGGDFNCISDQSLDSKNQFPNHQGLRGTRELFRTVKCHDLVDTWRTKHPSVKRFTFHSADNSKATRIDKIFLSRELSIGSESEITAFPLSDRDLVTTKISNLIKKTGRGYWKCNTSYLPQAEFQHMVKSTWAVWKKQKRIFDQITEWWDKGKANLKRAVISFSVNASRRRNLERKCLLKEIDQLQSKIDNGDSSCAPRLKAARLEFLKNTQKQDGSKFQSYRPSTKIKGEVNIQCPNTKDPDSKRMQSLNGRDGSVTEDPVVMTETCRQYYEALYTTAPVEQKEIDFFLESIDRSLSSEEQNSLEEPVTLPEVQTALFSMEAGKSPGQDGLPADFYKTFFNEIGQDICDVINTVFENGNGI